nr:NADH-quinone oxidoreductase subunit L [Altererythrobacter sp. KTW20L]
MIIVFAPLVAALIAGLGNRMIGNLPAKLVTTAGLFIACALSWPIFLGFVAGTETATVVPVLDWVRSGTMEFDWALRVDTLTAVMLVVITSVSALVHLYSWGYMDEDPDQPRFFAYLSLFTFAMLMLVTADNLVQMFFGWEGVGLASYLLIGFWFKKPSANAAAIKAFVVNRVGDLGFMLGIFGTFLVFQTTSIPEILAASPAMAGVSHITFMSMRLDTMTILCLLLFVGAMGKSAQLGLHTWLPDAMEGPTPVSALIHAATMVTAGVFMVCRLSPMFEAAPIALYVVTFVGAATCLFAATVGTTQWDIKRVIAYSTCSQLGYMFFAAGVGAYGAAMFHLFTHAFFKALLFLGAGAVIHAMHHEQDMRFYGGLRKKIPITFWAMMAGTLAITGVGVYDLGVGFAGFFSKDAIIEVAFASGSEMGLFAFWVGVFAALLTSFYSWRLMFLTFWGKPRWAASEHIQHAIHDAHGHDGVHDTHGHGHEEDNAPAQEHAGEDAHHHAPDPDHGEGTGGYHPHESPWVMLIPLVILSIGAVAAGYVFKEAFLDEAAFWNGSIAYNEALMHAMHEVPWWVKNVALLVMLLGLLTAWYGYIRNTRFPAQVADQLGPIYKFVFNKWYFDELYNYVFVKPSFWLGRVFWQRGDIGLIDRFGPDGSALVVEKGALFAKKVQSGYLYSYALVMLLGLVAAISWVIFR